MEMGATDYFDISNTHAITPPEQVSDLRAEPWNALISPFGIEDFWITEVELAKHGDESYTEEEQADVLVKQFVTAFANGAKRIFHAHLMIPEGEGGPFAEAALILLRFENGEENPPTFIYKPSYYAFQTMMMIDGFSTVEQLGDGQFVFTMPDGKNIWVIWESGAQADYLPENIIITQLDGSQDESTASEFSSSDRPVFIQEGTLTATESIHDAKPSDFVLSNYPNPFNPSTTVRVQVPAPGNLSLNLYDMTGRLVSTIANENVSAGNHSYQIKTAGLSSGIYIVAVKTGGQSIQHKITLLK